MKYKSEYFYLTTTGRKSGLPREIEIWFVEHEGAYYLVAEGRENAHWVQNLSHNPAVRFWVGGVMQDGQARALRDEQAEAELVTAVKAKMEAKYNWSDGLIVEVRGIGSLG